jgi:anti-anti-sigma factor
MLKHQEFQANVRMVGKTAVIDLRGEINNFADGPLEAAYSQAEAEDPSTISLNFSDVDYINSTGIALIVGLLARARQAHRQLLTFGLSEHYQEIFRITRLSDFMGMHEDEASALAAAE